MGIINQLITGGHHLVHLDTSCEGCQFDSLFELRQIETNWRGEVSHHPLAQPRVLQVVSCGFVFLLTSGLWWIDVSVFFLVRSSIAVAGKNSSPLMSEKGLQSMGKGLVQVWLIVTNHWLLVKRLPLTCIFFAWNGCSWRFKVDKVAVLHRLAVPAAKEK